MLVSFSYWMRDRRAVSSFFFDRLTLIRRLPDGCDCEFFGASFISSSPVKSAAALLTP